MPLPAKFNNVHYYRIAGAYTFAGDLVIARDALYFFPNRDLVTENIKRGGRHQGAIASAVREDFHRQHSYLVKHGLWRDGDTDEQFRRKADAHIAELRAQSKPADFSETLPIPTRITAAEVRGLKVGFMGVLSFEAQSDRQDFKVGVTRKKRLREALWEGGFSTGR